MPRGQKRNNREIRKPKQDKSAKVVAPEGRTASNTEPKSRDFPQKGKK